MSSDSNRVGPDPDVAAEQEPTLAESLFGDRIVSARAFAASLIEEGERRGLIGPLELPRIWTRHIINSVLIAPLLSGRVADVGSGGGLPGLVVAIARPDLSFTLIEPMERRVDWLSEQVESLELTNVVVLRARAEEAPRGGFDTVTARAVGNLAKLIPITVPLLAPGGRLLFLKGRSVSDEIANAGKAISRARLVDVEARELGTSLPTEVTNVFTAKLG